MSGSVHYVNILDELITEIGACYIIDRGYTDFERLYTLNINNTYFIIRVKANLQFKRVYSRKVDKSQDLICDRAIFLKKYHPAKDYPDKLRRIKFFDADNNKRLVFIQLITGQQ
ncbi:MAG: hypothetical protein U5K00_15545 [Melioribacteraceae bacterium]|nr:hypothetical protein [Melioribacteraceae bacterium]